MVAFMSGAVLPQVEAGTAGKVGGAIVGALSGAGIGYLIGLVGSLPLAFGGAALFPMLPAVLITAGIGAAIGYGGTALAQKIFKGTKGLGSKIVAGLLGAVGGAAAGYMVGALASIPVLLGGAALFPMMPAVLIGAGLGAVAGVFGTSLIMKFFGRKGGGGARGDLRDAEDKTDVSAKEQYEAAHRRYLEMLEAGRNPGDPEVVEAYNEYRMWYDRYQQSK